MSGATVIISPAGYSVAPTYSLWFGANLPTAPTMFTTTYSLLAPSATPRGSYWVCTTASDFTTALASCALGDVIQLQAGNTFSGNFTLPDKGAGSAFVYIVSSAVGSLPAAGTRVGPSDASNMPKIVGAGGGAALTFPANSHHWRIVGCEITAPASTYSNTLVAIGGDTNTPTTCPNNITFDRCYIHMDATAGGRRTIAAHGRYIEVTECYLYDAKEVGADTQAIWSCHGQGPYRYTNNQLTAAGECVLFGGGLPGANGSTPPNAGLIPSDIYIARNLFTKPGAWDALSWTNKNLLEFKLCLRALVEKNHFEYAGGKDQHGYAMLITPRDENSVYPPPLGWFPQAETSDIEIRYNRIVNCAQGMTIAGIDDGDTLSAFGRTSQISKRIRVHNNYLNVTNVDQNGTTFDGRVFLILGPPDSLVIDHNTCINAGNVLIWQDGVGPATKFVFTNNVCTYGLYGWCGTGTIGPNNTIATYEASNFAVKNSAYIDIFTGGTSTGSFPSGNFFPANTAAVAFTNAGAGDYSLGSGSPYKAAGVSGLGLAYTASGTADSTDLGADFTQVAA